MNCEIYNAYFRNCVYNISEIYIYQIESSKERNIFCLITILDFGFLVIKIKKYSLIINK